MKQYSGNLQDLEQLANIILHGREERHIDYKSSMSWKDRDAKIITIRCILGMTNLRDSGHIVFGVTQQGNDFVYNGMDQDHIESFTQDNVDTDLKNYADPSVNITLAIVPRKFVRDIAISKEIDIQNFAENGGDFAVIQVSEFDDIPVICKKDGKLKNGDLYLRNGAVYTRPKGKVETSETRINEMREIVEMAVDKNREYFIERVARILSEILVYIQPKPSDEQKYDEQIPDKLEE